MVTKSNRWFIISIKNFLRRRNLLIFCSLLFLASCNRPPNNNFVVTGKIENPPLKTVYLEKLSYDASSTNIVDSSDIAPSGEYTLKGDDTQQNLYVLTFKHSPAVIFINDANDLKINFDVVNFKTPEVSGSAATIDLYSFIHEYQRRDSMLSETFGRLENLKEQGANDSTLKALQMQGVEELNALNDEIKKDIKNSESPAYISFVLDKAKSSMQPQELSALIGDVSNRFPEHTGLHILKTDIDQYASNSNPRSSEYKFLNKQAPDLTMQDVNGKPVSISDFKGKYVLVDFWASWCAPCRQENPNVVAAYEKFKNKNFTILGVSLDNDKDAWVKAIKADNLTWTQMSDLKQWESAAVNTYQFDGIPFNVLINPDGKIIAQSLRGEELENKLSEVIK